VIVDCAVYANGGRRPGTLALDDAYEASREPGAFVWIGLHQPTPEEFESVRQEFNLHPLAVEDAIKAGAVALCRVRAGERAISTWVQIAMASSSNATANRRLAGSSAASS
jgi:hypothetical protein